MIDPILEKQIQDVVNTETNSFSLSQKLFGDNGLFRQLGPTYEARKEIVQTALFQRAQEKLRKLESHEAAVMKTALDPVSNLFPNLVVKVESLPRE